MRWILAGCWALVLATLSAAQNGTVQVKQKPRFFGLTPGHDVYIYCVGSQPGRPGVASWYKASRYDAPWEERTPIKASEKFAFAKKGSVQNAFLLVMDVQPEDSGVYFCRLDGVPGCGTEIQAARPIDRSLATYRSQLKDGLMVLQGLILAICIAAILTRRGIMQREKTDSVYEEPETDHIYEGLAIESCEGGLYEDLSAYAQVEDTEAPWE